MHVCRFCHADEADERTLVKYGVRHYAHHLCWLDRHGADEAPFAGLSAWQVGRFPYFPLKERGLLDAARAAGAEGGAA